jgi:hypothetical protein
MSDTPMAVEGDRGFVGVDERGSPGELPSGYLASATNKRMRNRRIEDAGGTLLCPWGLGTDGHTVFPNPIHAMVFTDRQRVRWLIVVCVDAVYRTRPNAPAATVPLPAGATIPGPARCVQAGYDLILARGPEQTPLRCRALDTGFEEFPDEPGTGTLTIPNFTYGEFIKNRLIVAAADDQAPVSDPLNFSRYSLFNALRISQGDGSNLQRIVAYSSSTAVAFKDRRIFYLANLADDFSGVTLEVLADNEGLAAPDAVTRVGNDLYFLGSRGVSSIGLTTDNRLRALDVPLSDPLVRTFGRVNGAAITAARMAYWDNKLYVALPLDDAKVIGTVNLTAGYTHSGTTYVQSVTAGRRYRYVQNSASDTALNNNGEILFGDADFVAGASLVTFNGTTGQPVAGLYEVPHVNVNTGIAVYDFVNRAWSGVDERNGILHVLDFAVMPLDGVDRLFALMVDGRLRLLEEGPFDEVRETLAVPYADVLVRQTSSSGLLRINPGSGGASVLADNANTVNQTGSATDWGCQTLADARTNLWQDTGGTGGYNPSATSPWSAPNTTPTQIDGGVSFAATNGTLPAVEINSSVLTESGAVDAWFASLRTGEQTVSQPFTSSFTTRGYALAGVRRSRGQHLLIALATWDAAYTVQAFTDGVNETANVLTRTRSRTAFATQGVAAFAEGNAGDNATTPYREDYSIVLPELGMDFGSNGFWVDAEQSVEETLSLRPARGRYVQVRVDKTTGTLASDGILLGGTAEEATRGTKV